MAAFRSMALAVLVVGLALLQIDCCLAAKARISSFEREGVKFTQVEHVESRHAGHCDMGVPGAVGDLSHHHFHASSVEEVVRLTTTVLKAVRKLQKATGFKVAAAESTTSLPETEEVMKPPHLKAPAPGKPLVVPVPPPDVGSSEKVLALPEEMTFGGTWSRFDLHEDAADRVVEFKAFRSFKTKARDLEFLHKRDGKTRFEIATGGRLFTGEVNGDKYVVETCEDLMTRIGSSEMLSSRPYFMPKFKMVPALRHCPHCIHAFRWRIRAAWYMVLSDAKKIPQIAYSRDGFVNITTWKEGKSWSVPKLDKSKCPTSLDKDSSGSSVSTGDMPLLKDDMVMAPPGSISSPSGVLSPRSMDDSMTRRVFVEEEAEETTDVTKCPAAPVEGLGKPNSACEFTVKATNNWKFWDRTHKMYFKRSPEGRWMWATDEKKCWMLVATAIPLCGGKKGDKPRKKFLNLLNSLWKVEQGSIQGQKPLTENELTHLLGKSTSTNRWRVQVDWSEDLYFKLSTTPSWKFEWSPNDKTWYPVTTKEDTRPWYKKERLTKANKQLIDALLYYEKKAAKSEQSEASKCHTEWKGDGFCDEACNNDKNNFDNGDCCRGTCYDNFYPCGSNGYHCVKKIETKPCLFLHGAGVSGPQPPKEQPVNPTPVSSMQALGYKSYWGQMREELDGLCTSVTFSFAETNDIGWDNKALQKGYYDMALKSYNRKGIIFGHSMANPILAGACMDQQLCSVRWFNLGGPIRGSRAANAVQKIAKVYPPANSPSTKSLAYKHRGLRKATTQREELGLTVYKHNLYKGLMCGVTGSGSGGLAGVGLALASGIAYGTKPSDGFVGLDECEMFGWYDKKHKKWKQWYLLGEKARRDRSFYAFKTLGNHLDENGARGNYDGIMDWFRNMVKNDRTP